jgi:hypothetical protein
MNSRKYGVRLFLALVSMLLVSACDAGTQWVFESQESERYSFTRFIESIEKFPYTADQSKSSRVREGFKRLSLGMKKDEVRKVMGEPDAESLNYKPMRKSKELIYTTWDFYLKRREAKLATDGFDEAIYLYFKPNGELYWADPSNIAELKPLGGPHLHPEGSIPITNR